MRLAVLVAALGAVLVTSALSACGADEPRLARSCTDSQVTLATALRSAPAQVRLPDGSRISDCVRGADDDGEQQQFGVLVVGLGDQLAPLAAGDERQAARLGYLVGAARVGAAKVNGIIDELVYRLESSGRALNASPPEVRAAFVRGQREGERLG